MSGFSLQLFECSFDCLKSVWNKVFAAREYARLISWKHDDVAALHDVIDPCAVIQRVRTTPTMQEDHNRRLRGLWFIRLVNPILRPAFSVSILDYDSMR